MNIDEVKAIALMAVFRAVAACNNATGQHRAILMFVNNNQIANEVADAWCKAQRKQKASTTAP